MNKSKCENQMSVDLGCQEKIRYEDYYQHVTQNCGDLNAECKCGAHFKQKLLKTHINDECPNQIVECSKCHLQMPRRDIHQNVDQCLESVLLINK